MLGIWQLEWPRIFKVLATSTTACAAKSCSGSRGECDRRHRLGNQHASCYEGCLSVTSEMLTDPSKKSQERWIRERSPGLDLHKDHLPRGDALYFLCVEATAKTLLGSNRARMTLNMGIFFRAVQQMADAHTINIRFQLLVLFNVARTCVRFPRKLIIEPFSSNKSKTGVFIKWVLKIFGFMLQEIRHIFAVHHLLLRS